MFHIHCVSQYFFSKGGNKIFGFLVRDYKSRGDNFQGGGGGGNLGEKYAYIASIDSQLCTDIRKFHIIFSNNSTARRISSSSLVAE